MPAYVIVYRNGPVRDQQQIQEYHRKTREMPRDPKLKPLVIYGAVHALEGAPPDAVIVLEFPSVADARAWYDSPGYQAALPHRLNAGDFQAVIVEGVAAS